MIKNPGPIRSVFVALESIDVAITVTGRQTKSRMLHPNATLSPFITTCIAGYGATVWRYLDAKFRGAEPECPW
jgi:hypothetical protein